MTPATLTINGPLELLAEIAADLNARYPDGLQAEVVAADWEGWTVEAAAALLGVLAAKQRKLITEMVKRNGFIDSEDLRLVFGDSLRGLTGPVSKHFLRLTAEGRLPAGLPRPIESRYDADNRSFQRTQGLVMPAPLARIFATAMGV